MNLDCLRMGLLTRDVPGFAPVGGPPRSRLLTQRVPGLAPAGESLSFAGPNESNQSKGPDVLKEQIASDVGLHLAGAPRPQTPTKQVRASISAREFGKDDGARCGEPELTSATRSARLDRWCLSPRRAGQMEARLSKQSAFSGHQALCFGYFHLGQQMKVTRPPGRDPARIESTERPGAKPDSPRPKTVATQTALRSRRTSP